MSLHVFTHMPVHMPMHMSIHVFTLMSIHYDLLSEHDSAVGTTPLALGEKRDLSQRWKSCGIRSQKIESLRQRMKAHSYGQSGQDPRKLFKHFDRDNTGELDFDEFKAAVRKVGRMTAKQITDKVRVQLDLKIYRVSAVSLTCAPSQTVSKLTATY